MCIAAAPQHCRANLVLARKWVPTIDVEVIFYVEHEAVCTGGQREYETGGMDRDLRWHRRHYPVGDILSVCYAYQHGIGWVGRWFGCRD